MKTPEQRRERTARANLLRFRPVPGHKTYFEQELIMLHLHKANRDHSRSAASKQAFFTEAAHNLAKLIAVA